MLSWLYRKVSSKQVLPMQGREKRSHFYPTRDFLPRLVPLVLVLIEPQKPSECMKLLWLYMPTHPRMK